MVKQHSVKEVPPHSKVNGKYLDQKKKLIVDGIFFKDMGRHLSD